MMPEKGKSALKNHNDDLVLMFSCKNVVCNLFIFLNTLQREGRGLRITSPLAKLLNGLVRNRENLPTYIIHKLRTVMKTSC